MSEKQSYIEIVGARVNNLRNINVDIPHKKLTVITGLSGSGKSSLAFDTIFAEGQRRYIDTFSAYARGYIGQMSRPDVDKITGLSPVISIDQKTTNRNPRSTVGTTTEVYDYLRLLYARAGEAYSYITGEKMVHYTDEQILELILDEFAGKRALVLSPLVRNRKGHYKELFERYRKKGFLTVRVDGEMKELVFGMRADRYKNHSIELVVDKLKINAKKEGWKQGDDGGADRKRLLASIDKAMQQGSGVMMIADADNVEHVRYYSRSLMCPTTGISYAEPAPHSFSFNSPQGACPCCHGLGYVTLLDIDKIVPNKRLSIADGAIVPLGKHKKSPLFEAISNILQKYDADLKTAFSDLPEEAISEIMNGSDTEGFSFSRYEGVLRYLELQQDNSASESEQKWASQYSKQTQCPECRGQRLNKEALSFRIYDKNIAELAEMDILQLDRWLSAAEAHLNEKQTAIATEILKEIHKRLGFMLSVGLSYLSLSRSSDSLSGGESQRIRLATQIGSQLVNVLYILDEPSIGLHQRDNQRLIDSLKQLRDMGNTIIVVEHDEQMMREADYIVDIGPKAGRLGGQVMFQGTPKELLKTDTLTAQYLKQSASLDKKSKETKTVSSSEKVLTLRGCSGNNLKHIDVSFPLGRMICVTGVSGSGKSTLVNQTLYPLLSQHFYRSLQDPMPYDKVEGIEWVDKVIAVDQSPIGRTPRSNPATYTGVFSDIRSLFAALPESQIRAYKPGRFSFNTAGGRCEECAGNGYKTIQMHFLPDVYVPCESCGGKRYNQETLQVRFKGKTIADVLDMTINQAVEFFEAQPTILNKIKTLQEVGLGYVKLGQSSTTLSGGESQRMKLAAELSRKDTGNTLYILDEPTTGLHFHDIQILLSVLRRLQQKGNTIIIIEHNLDVIREADYLIDMGPEGGSAGGKVIAVGTPDEIKANPASITGHYL